MDTDALRIEIVCEERAAEELREVFVIDDQPEFIERRNISGDAATWIVVATLGVKALSRILDFITKWRELDRVKKIKIGDLEIESPSHEDMEELRKSF